MPVLRLATTDPFLNLAIEEHVLERIHDLGPTLILWRNDPCVVIGRHQNPWLECDLAALRRHGLPLVRRISGGGAVYHDGGNTNFSFLASESDYDQERHFRVVISGLSRLGIAAWKTDRNDLRVGDRKISGNAFRHTRGRSLHHGTLLVNADLDRLTAFLTPSAALIETKAIPSVRSRVVNLSDARPGLTHEPLGDAIAQAYAAEYGEDAARPIVADPGSWDTIRSRRAELASWEWVFGHTPTFVRKVVVEGADVALTVKRGAIVSVERGTGDDGAVPIVGPPPQAANPTADPAIPTLVQALREAIVGVRYDREALLEAARSSGARAVRSLAERID